MKVLVVGGGIAGLVAARALALKGAHVTLLERKPRIADEGGIGIGLQSNAMSALGEIGLGERCVAAGVPVEVLHVCAPDGTRIGTRPAERYNDCPWPGFTGIGRAALHSILVEGAGEAGVTLLTDAEVTAIETDEGSAHVRLNDGRAFSADLLVIADGIYSRSRAHLFPETPPPVPTGEAVWRALVPGVQKHDVSFIFGGGLGTIGYTPLKDDLYLYVVDRAEHAPPRDATDLAARLIELLRPFGGFVPELLGRMSHRPGDVTHRKLETVLVPPPWHRGRAVLIGDAAHAGPPTLAQGAAMGIEDGVVLAQLLAETADIGMALDQFMTRRFDRVRTVVECSLAIAHAQMQPDARALVMAAQQRAAEALAHAY